MNIMIIIALVLCGGTIIGNRIRRRQVLCREKRRQRTVPCLLLAALMAVFWVPVQARAASDESEMSLFSINIRKADAHLLRCGSSVYLIDTGKKKDYETLYRALKENGADRLTGVILTHSHSDHTGGLKKLMQSDIVIENVYMSAFYAPNKEDKDNPVVKALKDTGIEPISLKSGDTLPLDGGELLVLGPLEEMTDPEEENSNSLVLLASGGGGTILLTGDMEFPEEASLLNAGLIPHADVIKIGNHGEGDATSDQLIAAVSPSIAVISTNTEDEPDTPDPRVMRLLTRSGITVLQTQQAENGVLITIRNGEIVYEMR